MSYHNKITQLCFEFGKNINKGIINSFKECPLTISHLRDLREDCYKYKPDVYFIRDDDKRYITFQVLSSQGKKPKEIVGDILNAILTFQIKMGYFVVKSEEDFKRVDNLLKISYSILQDIYKLKKVKDLPDLKAVLIEDKHSNDDIKNILEDINKKDKWTS